MFQGRLRQSQVLRSLESITAGTIRRGMRGNDVVETPSQNIREVTRGGLLRYRELANGYGHSNESGCGLLSGIQVSGQFG